MPAKENKRYGYVLEDPQITRWYDDVARGSRITADVYLRRFGIVLEEKNLSPQDILKVGQGDQNPAQEEVRTDSYSGLDYCWLCTGRNQASRSHL
jgi:hypothetical protein